MNQDRPEYDHEGMIEGLAKPISDWAKTGFIRGFVGKGKSFLPKGRLALPSQIFFELAKDSIHDGSPDAEEFERRMAFTEKVQDGLITRQSELIEKGNRATASGRFADMAVGLLFLGLIAALIYFHGPYHWITITFLVIFASDLLVMHFVGKRLADKAQKDFEGASRQIDFPWITGS